MSPGTRRRVLLGTVGVLSVLYPRRVLQVNARLNLIGYENAAEVRPTDRLVRVTRWLGAAMVGAALLGPDEHRERRTEA